MTLLTAIGIVLIGFAIGCGVNYLADVLPLYRRPGQSLCAGCGSPLSWKNYLFNKPCDQCGSRWKIRSWITTCLYPLAGIFIWVFPPIRLAWWSAVLLLIYFGVVTIIDLEHRVILQEVSLTGAFIGVIYGFLLHGWQMTLIGGAAGYGIMFAIYLFGILFTRLMARVRNQEIDEVALGFGDVNLAGILGLILGWPGILLGLVFAILTGGLASAVYMIVLKIIKKYELFTAIPYAPYLIFGAILLLYRPG